MTRASTIPLASLSTGAMATRSTEFDRAHDDAGAGFDRIERMQFAAMTHALRPHGGLIGDDVVMQGLRRVCDQPVSRLARWIVSGSVISIGWRGQTLLPAFQFDPVDMSIVPCVAEVLQELRPVFDNRELALWFAEPNAWLADAPPVALLERDARSVVQAARTDRFVARG